MMIIFIYGYKFKGMKAIIIFVDWVTLKIIEPFISCNDPEQSSNE